MIQVLMNVMRIAAPNPAVNPVINLKTLLLCLKPKNCVIPSTNNGKIMIIDGINNKE